MQISRNQPTYVSLSVSHDDNTSIDTPINAIIEQRYEQPIIKNGSDYVMAVERMEISTNGIPFYDASSVEQITLRSVPNPATTTTTTITTSAYSLSHLFEILNGLTYTHPDDVVNFPIKFSINKDGFIIMSLGGGYRFDTVIVELPYYLNLILGISTTVQLNTLSQATSKYPRLDLGDDFNHIVLTSNLQTVSDSVGQSLLNVLTDFAPPTSYSNSLTYNADSELIKNGFSTNMRQKIIYNPAERRYLDIISPFQIQFIRIEANYVNAVGDTKRIKLPFGGTFELKLAFFKK